MSDSRMWVVFDKEANQFRVGVSSEQGAFLSKRPPRELNEMLNSRPGQVMTHDGDLVDVVAQIETHRQKEGFRQVGGSHYLKQKIQPWDVIDANELDFYQGNILKYVMRWRDKGGVADLEKAMHTLQHYIEVVKRVNGDGSASSVG